MKGMPTGEKPKAKLARFHHDFSARRVYTSKAGYIEPAKPIDLVPHEHVEVDVSDFLQSMPLNTAAFLRGRKEFSFYYVPYVQLWANFGQYMAGRDDKFSSAMKGRTYEPRISLRLLYWCAAQMMLQDLVYETNRTAFTGNFTYECVVKLFRSNITATYDLGTDAEMPSVRGYHATMKKDDGTLFSPTKEDFSRDMFGLSRWSNFCRKLDLLRYGNLLPYLSRMYDAALTTGSGTTEASFRASYYTPIVNYLKGIPANYYVEPWRLLAYNKIFYTFFRNSYYDLEYYVGNYNVDDLDCSSLETSVIGLDHFSPRFFDIYSHQWKKDMFTSLMPDTQFGAVSALSVDVSNIVGDGSKIGSLSSYQVYGSGNNVIWYGDDVPSQPSPIDAEFSKSGVNYSPLDANHNPLKYPNDRYIGQLPNQGQVNSSVGSLGITGTGSFDVLALRRAEAIQGYRQTLLRCGNKTKDIMRGIYGVEPAWENDHDPYFIDSFGYDFAVDRVMQTATTDTDQSTYNGKLGDLGGQVATLGQSKHTIKFTSQGDFGVLMPLCYIVIESEYNSYNLDPNILALTPEDHYIPDFQDLGFVPVTREVLSNMNPLVTGVLGYGTRYYEKKIDIDLVHGILCSYASFGNDVPLQGQWFGDFSHWVTPRTDMQSITSTTTKQFYIDPRILNTNFLLAADGRQETDQFINNTYFKVHRINTISDLGLPKF